MVEMFVEADPEDEDPQKTLTEVQLNFYESVVSGNLDLGAPIIDAMADNRVVKTSYMDENEDGKEEYPIKSQDVHNDMEGAHVHEIDEEEPSSNDYKVKFVCTEHR